MAAKKRVHVKNRSRVKFSEVDGDMKIGKGATIIAEDKTIVVHGKIKNKGGFKCKGNLEVLSIESTKGNVKIYGDLKAKREVESDKKLIVTGSLEAEDVSAGMTVKVKKDVKADKISAGFQVDLSGNAEVESISAGARIILTTGKVGKASAGMSVITKKDIDLNKVSAGMRIKLIGISKVGKASAGMSVISKNDAEIDVASAGMSVKLLGKTKVGKVSAGMRIKAKNTLEFGVLSAGMSVILKKDAVGEKASAGFRIYGKSNVTLSGSASAGFSILACKKLESEKLSAGKKIKAKFIKAETINVARRGKLIGKVQAGTVVLNERARAKNLYVSELEMLERSKARNVFADNITIEDYAILSGKVEYTGSINAEEKARIWAKPKKVKELPTPKF